MNNAMRDLSSIFAENEGPQIEAFYEGVYNTPRHGSAKTSDGSQEPVTQACALDLCIPPQLAVFAGHFPEHPVLPGIVQIDWAAKIAARYFNTSGRFQKLNNVKFTSMVFPNAKLTLKLAFNPHKNHIKFTYSAGETLYSSGTLVYTA